MGFFPNSAAEVCGVVRRREINSAGGTVNGNLCSALTPPICRDRFVVALFCIYLPREAMTVAGTAP